jgi:hypothetical protein
MPMRLRHHRDCDFRPQRLSPSSLVVELVSSSLSSSSTSTSTSVVIAVVIVSCRAIAIVVDFVARRAVTIVRHHCNEGNNAITMTAKSVMSVVVVARHAVAIIVDNSKSPAHR